MIKAILGYDVEPGMTPEEYEQWLFDVHAPDLLANPHLDRLVFNKVLQPITTTSGGAATVPGGETFYRITELHYADEEAYAAGRAWFDRNPIPPERGPAGRTRFKFYVLTESMELTCAPPEPS
jgi:hypothetical protein